MEASDDMGIAGIWLKYGTLWLFVWDKMGCSGRLFCKSGSGLSLDLKFVVRKTVRPKNKTRGSHFLVRSQWYPSGSVPSAGGYSPQELKRGAIVGAISPRSNSKLKKIASYCLILLNMIQNDLKIKMHVCFSICDPRSFKFIIFR